MLTNWDLTHNNRSVAVGNYYGYWKMAKITLWGGPYVGVLGNWWCKVEHRDRVAAKIAAKYGDRPGHKITVSFPLPDVEDVGDPLFQPYETP